MKNALLLLAVLWSSFSSFSQKNDTVLILKNSDDSLSYAIGIDLAESFKANELEKLDLQILTKAMLDYYGEKAIFNTEDARQYIQVEMERKMEAKSIQGKEKGQKFLEENKQKGGVKTTTSGLQYKVIKEGNGMKPSATDTVVVHYHGTLIDGTVFDSSVERGETIEFPLNQVIEGWTEGVQLMQIGAKYMFYIPENLAYGSRSMGNIPAYSPLIFEVELFDVKKAR